MRDEDSANISLRLLNTNVKGTGKIAFALTEVKGVGRRYANLVCKKADVDLNKRAGELNSDELERIVTIMQNPAQFKIPAWFLNRQRDLIDGKNSHILSNQIDQKLRDDTERLKKIRSHRGLRHHWGLRVRGQHTKTTYVCDQGVVTDEAAVVVLVPATSAARSKNLSLYDHEGDWLGGWASRLCTRMHAFLQRDGWCG